MAAYIIARNNVTDPEQYAKYRAKAPAAIAAFGGKYLARGGAVECLEGPGEDRRMIILEFPDMETARKFYHSELYQEAKALREGAADNQIIIVDGYDG